MISTVNYTFSSIEIIAIYKFKLKKKNSLQRYIYDILIRLMSSYVWYICVIKIYYHSLLKTTLKTCIYRIGQCFAFSTIYMT